MNLITKEHISKQLIINHDEPKTFVFDLDGTIIYKGRPLEKRFEKLLLNIKSAGHTIIFATGRSWRDFVPVVPAWCVGESSVLFGGGLALSKGEIKCQHLLPEKNIYELLTTLEDNDLNYLLDGRNDFYHPEKEHWLYDDIIKLTGQKKAQTVDSVITDGVYKVLVLDDVWINHFDSYIKGNNLAIKHHSYDKCFDIMPSHVNKYNGLINLELPKPENIFIFGNDHNDLELMQELPNSIMLGNHPELIKYAKVQVEYDDELFINFETVINTILKK